LAGSARARSLPDRARRARCSDRRDPREVRGQDDAAMIRLDDLVQPLGAERFIAEHLLAELPFMSAANAELADRLRGLAPFASPEALVARLTRPVGLMGPDYFRGQVAPDQALGSLAQGFTLYIRSIEEELAEVRAVTKELAGDLGAANLGIVVE